MFSILPDIFRARIEPRTPVRKDFFFDKRTISDLTVTMSAYGGYHLDDLGDYDDDDMEVTELDAQTQARLDAVVDKLLKGYDWTLAPLANK